MPKKKGVTVEEAARAEGVGRATIFRRLRDGVYESIPGFVAPNGRQSRLVLLPERGGSASAQDAGLELSRGSPSDTLPLPAPGPAASLQFPTPASSPEVPGIVPLTPDGLPDETRMPPGVVREYRRRVAALARYDELLDRGVRKGLAVTRVAGEENVEPRTFRDWRNLRAGFRQAGLVPLWGPGRGRTIIPEELQRKVKAFYLDRRRPPITQVFREIVVAWCREHEADLPDRSTVRRYIRTHVLPAEEVAFREGPRAFAAHCSPKVRRDWSEAKPNDIVVVDNRLLDFLVVRPDGQGTGWQRWGKLSCPCGSAKSRADCCSLVRLWGCFIIDAATWALLGWSLGPTPSAAGACSAARMMLNTTGTPRSLYRDNGADLTSRLFGGKAARLREPSGADVGDATRWPGAMPRDVEEAGLWPALGVRLITTVPFRAWAKPIESFFAEFFRRFENLLPGTVGRSPGQRPENLPTYIEKGLFLTADEFKYQVFPQVVHKWNSTYIGRGRKLTPLEQYRGVTLRIPAPETLVLLCQSERTVKVNDDGAILGGRRYWSPELAVYVGLSVRFRYDAEDPSIAFAYPPNAAPLTVPAAADASPFGFSQVNRDTKRGKRLLTARLALIRDQLKGALTPAEADPTGAFRLVAARIERVQLEAADRAAQEQQQALLEASRPPALKAPSSAPSPAEDDVPEKVPALRGAALLAQCAAATGMSAENSETARQWARIVFDCDGMRQDLRRLSRAEARALHEARYWPREGGPLLDNAAAAAEARQREDDCTDAGDIVAEQVLRLLSVGTATLDGSLCWLTDVRSRLESIRRGLSEVWKADGFVGADPADLEVLSRYDLLPCALYTACEGAAGKARHRRAM